MQSNQLMTAVRAGYYFFYCETKEMLRCFSDIYGIVKDFSFTTSDGTDIKYLPVSWDYEQAAREEDDTEETPADSFMKVVEGSPRMSVVIGKNAHWNFQDDYGNDNKLVVAWLQNKADDFSSPELRRVIVLVGDETYDKAIPDSVKTFCMPLDFALPNVEEIGEVLDKIVSDAKTAKPDIIGISDDVARQQIIDNSKSLTKQELINAYSFSLIKDNGCIDPLTIADLRSKVVEAMPGLKLARFTTTFDEYKGNDNVVRFFQATVRSPLAKGLLLLGPAGTGKTMFAQAASNWAGMPCIIWELAQMFGSLVGESEKMMARAIAIIKSMAPCILFIDEIEKGLSGSSGRGQSGDGGTTTRSMSQFLKFLSDDAERQGIYVIATCNDITSIDAAWVRAERWDTAPFFIDLPNANEQKAILDYYKSVYDVKGAPSSMDGWSGAEIKSLCRIAAMMDKKVNQVEDFIVPVSKTMKTEIEALRKWSKGKTIPASTEIKSNGKRAMVM